VVGPASGGIDKEAAGSGHAEKMVIRTLFARGFWRKWQTGVESVPRRSARPS
jgi:hypothetical protein